MKQIMNLLLSPLLILAIVSCDVPTSNMMELLEPYVYREDFETNELSAWASCPLWQDTAFDPNMRVSTIVPGDSNLSIMQIITPYTNVDNYGGAQKLLDMYMVEGSSVKLRYYLKTHLHPEFIKIRLAAGPDGSVEYLLPNPVTNEWVGLQVGYKDFVKQNSQIPRDGIIKVNALAVMAKFPKGDPAMPIFFGIDDVEFSGARSIPFNFSEPEVYELSEWKPRVPKKHFKSGESFTVNGKWPIGAEKVSISIASFTDRQKNVFKTELTKKEKNEWDATFDLAFPNGMYLATLEAMDGDKKLAETQFTIFLAPDELKGIHPRTTFNNKSWIMGRLNSPRFSSVKKDMIEKAKNHRQTNPVKDILYNVDQFPGPDISPVMGSALIGWSSQIDSWRLGIRDNALVYSLLGDKEAGEYAKNLLVKISGFPQWLHPWWKGRGQHIYYPVGMLGMDAATGYDLLYDLMTEEERSIVRKSLTEKIIVACHKGYVEDNLVTNNTSNWVSHITSGSLMAGAAIYGDDEKAQVEPYFTGVVIKTNDFIQKAFGSDGSYGEGLGYYNFTMLTLSESLPVMGKVFKIDMSGKVNGSYKELVWAGNIREKKSFYFGDSGGDIPPMVNWAWLLDKYHDPLLGWMYQQMKKEETFMDVLYETDNVPKDDPFDENPVKVFRDVGTTVFKSGWGTDDFIFVMRTGAFYNHQHLDQGTFWLSDLGSIFVGERHGSTYYLDPFYQSHYTQPIGHSTILLDHNQQSQRTGDPLVFAEGFNDKAFIYHFLDGTNTAFSSGDIGKLYWGKVKQIRRNVLYLKPRTLLMIDVVIPEQRDVDVSLLYQAGFLEDIRADQATSVLAKDGHEMKVIHVYPDNRKVEPIQTPHFLSTLLNERPLHKEGLLKITANTKGKPLVVANILTTAKEEESKISFTKNEGFVRGTIQKQNVVFSTSPDNIYSSDSYSTDALTMVWDGTTVFAAVTKLLKEGEKMLIASEEPFTCEITGNTIKYYHDKGSEIFIGVENKPVSVKLNGSEVAGWAYDQSKGGITINLPEGEGRLVIN